MGSSVPNQLLNAWTASNLDPMEMKVSLLSLLVARGLLHHASAIAHLPQ
jgi:hypothetical protein